MKKYYALLVELTQRETALNFVPFYQNTYYLNAINQLSNIGDYLFPELYNSFDKEIDTNLIGIKAEGALETFQLSAATSKEECIQNKESFYYASVTKDIYAHFPSHKPHGAFDNIIFEFVVGFSKTNLPYTPIINDSPYDKKLSSAPRITKQLDDELQGVQTFKTFGFSIDNSDGELDGWINDPTFGLVEDSSQRRLKGNLVRYLAQTSETASDIEDYDKYTIIQQGYIDSLSDGTEIQINAIDIRANINEQIATRAIDTSFDYPDMKQGIIIPWTFGTIYGHKSICLNKNINKEKLSSETTASIVYQEVGRFSAIQAGDMDVSFQMKMSDDVRGSVLVKQNFIEIGTVYRSSLEDDEYVNSLIETVVEEGDIITLEAKVNTGDITIRNGRGLQDYKYAFSDIREKEIEDSPIFGVYIDTVEQDSADYETSYYEDFNNNMAVFELDYNLFNTGQDGKFSFKLQDKVSIDMTGYVDDSLGSFTGVPGSLIDRGMNQIRFLLNKVKGARYNALNYDLGKWGQYENDTNYNFKTGIAFSKPTKGFEVIDDIANKSLFAKFQIDSNLKYSWDTDDFEGQGLAGTFDKYDLKRGWLTGPSIPKKYDNILPFFWVQYQFRADTDKEDQTQYYDNSFEQDAFDRYGITGGEDNTTFQTYLSEEADVIKYADRVHAITDIPYVECNITLADWNLGTGVKSQEINPGDFVQVELLDDNGRGYGQSIIKILSINPSTGGNLPEDNSWTVAIKGRIIKWVVSSLISTDDNTELITEDSGNFVIASGDAVISDII